MQELSWDLHSFWIDMVLNFSLISNTLRGHNLEMTLDDPVKIKGDMY